jgi:hypothetical protein
MSKFRLVGRFDWGGDDRRDEEVDFDEVFIAKNKMAAIVIAKRKVQAAYKKLSKYQLSYLHTASVELHTAQPILKMTFPTRRQYSLHETQAEPVARDMRVRKLH